MASQEAPSAEQQQQVEQGLEEPTHLLFQAALSAAADTLAKEPTTEREFGKKSTSRSSDGEARKQLVGKNKGVPEDLDTASLSDLVSFCREREREEREMQEVMREFLASREKARQHSVHVDPWKQISDLAEHAICVQSTLRETQAKLVRANETAALLKSQADKWQTQAEGKGVAQSREVHEHLKIVENLESQLQAKCQECDELRKQRDYLEGQVEEERASNELMSDGYDHLKAERDNNKYELQRVKRNAELSTQRLSKDLALQQKELAELREHRKIWTAQQQKLEAENAQLIKVKLTQEKQVWDLQQRVVQAEERVKDLNFELAEKEAKSQEQQLAAKQEQISSQGLGKRNNKLQRLNEELHAKLLREEQARVESFKEHEEKLAELYAQLEAGAQKEAMWKAKLGAAQQQTRMAEEEIERAASEAQARIESLEGTLNGLLRNMQTLSKKKATKTTTTTPVAPKEQVDEKHEPAEDLVSLQHPSRTSVDGHDRDVITEKANRIRMEIQAATAKLYGTRSEREEVTKAHQPLNEKQLHDGRNSSVFKSSSCSNNNNNNNCNTSNSGNQNKAARTSPYANLPKLVPESSRSSKGGRSSSKNNKKN